MGFCGVGVEGFRGLGCSGLQCKGLGVRVWGFRVFGFRGVDYQYCFMGFLAGLYGCRIQGLGFWGLGKLEQKM